METWLPLIAGLALLVLGGELLVRGAVGVASRLGVSPLVIGLTLVGFGTSTPELVTSVQAALADSPGIAYGNIVGSNIANILLILGASALITPVAVASGALKRDGAVMIAVAAIFIVLGLSMPLGRIVGLLFLLALASYVYTAFRQESRGAAHGALYDKAAATQEADPALAPVPAAAGSLAVPLLIAGVGLALVVLGGVFLVSGAVSLARSFGISETVIGLTIVAVGTSMPELITSVMAAIRKEAEVAFGNIVGSNIYNILGIGGTTAVIAPTQVPAEILGFDNYVMLVASVLVIALAWTGRIISRAEGAALVLGYAIYVAWLWP
ncbi:calcium/sodium antiporter [Roseitranquillus sediminis]|uniref:calcium/sodium antiporter n=1 Tax=Roseitranquillus sediminis TaxID=2809051 RepID=UPI001D0CA1F8|nr:calcium/sodium antiporter [Roseitranquillus sediminis]MBM9596031.1 calcium/sodium antiporter [Roseitranquillus sediminis]